MKKENGIIVINKDKEFLEKEIIPLMKKFTKNKITLSKSSSGYGDFKYLLRVWDKTLLKKLQKEYGIPRGKKDKINLPKLSTRKEIDFLLGWIAGDGSVTNDRTRAKIEIWSKDNDLLKRFHRILLKRNINSTMFSATNNRFILRIGKIKDVKKFSKYKIPHPKKRRKLKAFLAPA
jgi:hypothetical protein